MDLQIGQWHGECGWLQGYHSSQTSLSFWHFSPPFLLPFVPAALWLLDYPLSQGTLGIVVHRTMPSNVGIALRTLTTKVLCLLSSQTWGIWEEREETEKRGRKNEKTKIIEIGFRMLWQSCSYQTIPQLGVPENAVATTSKNRRCA